MSDGVPARRLLFVRHGHYDRVDELGDEVWGLSPLGRRQAARTGKRLDRLVSAYGERFEGIYASPWPRALQTAEIIAHETGQDRVRVKEYLHEAVPLVPGPRPGERPLHPTLPPTDEEHREQTTAQIQRILARFFKGSRQDTTYVVVCHGNVIRYLVCETLGLPYESWMRIDSRHASITEFRVYPGGFRALVNYNDTSHLPVNMLST